jgi:hypothetical protein
MKVSIILRGSVVLLAALASACSTAEPEAKETPAAPSPGVAREALTAPEGFYIKSITGSGSGCPTLPTTILTPDGQTFTVYFSDMNLQHPPESTFKYLNCTVGVSLHVPHGWQFSVGTINTRGYAHLPANTSGRQVSSYFFAGVPLPASGHSTINGFYDGTYTFTDLITVGSAISSPCGQDTILNINTAIYLNTAGNPGTDAFFNNESIDGMFQKIFQFGWDHCVG